MICRFGMVAAAAILCVPTAAFGQSAAPAPATRIFGAYSVNADWGAVPFLFVVDQPVSPFLSLGGGSLGVEASIEKTLRGHLGLKASISRYVDPFRGTVAYCQPPFTCAVGVPFRADTNSLYITAGPVVTAREHERTRVFAHALVGAVRSSATFSFAGNVAEYVVNPTSLPTWLIVATGQPFGQPNTVSYGDRLSDAGLAAALGGGIERTLARRLQFRVSMDWNPTFLKRPKRTSNAELAHIPSERGMQSHARISFGLVWQIGR